MRYLLRSAPVSLATALLLSLYSPGYSSEYYKWMDESGNIHFSDSLANVPEKYRDQLESRKVDDDKTSSPEQPGQARPQLKSPPRGREEGKQAKKYEVPYKPFEDAEGSVKRVIIPVKFNGSVEAPLAIDTGSPDTLISVELAEKLGLFEKDKAALLVPIGGLGGTEIAVRSIVASIQVGDAVIHFVPIIIFDNKTQRGKKKFESFEGLLGLDFVSEYSMTVNAKKRTVVFEELQVDAEHPGGHDQKWWTDTFKEFASSCAGWKAYSEKVDRKIKSSMRSINNEDMDLKAFADYQYSESEKLLDKLNQYAVQNSVPMHWRTY